ncbi:MAG: hypothetical protein HQ581_13840, partial [Planctomycetes bacterium]|nr:hypothetical protein [Planctomycetota bacterium]
MRHDRRDDPVTRLQARRTVANSLLAATLLMFGAIAGCTNPAEERLVGTWYGFVVPSPEDESEADPDAERWPDWILEFRDVERVTVRKWRVKGYTAEF